MIAGEAFFNLGVVMGVVPPKGLVLPFISYGSSAMMANMTAIGILIGISAERKTPIDKGWYKAPSIASHAEEETSSKLSEALDRLDELGSVEESSVEMPTMGKQP